MKNSSSFLNLLKVAKNRKISPSDYRNFQIFQGELLVNYLESFKIEISDLCILDLACGLGGYSLALSRKSEKVTAMDLERTIEDHSVSFLVGDALKTPFAPHSFNLLICASLIEHVKSPESLLSEIIRLLPSGGYAYLSFPPFYSPVGGHQFSPYHYLGEKLAVAFSRNRELRSKNRWYKELFSEQANSYETAFGKWGLYPFTIKKMNRLLKGFPLKVVDRSTRWLPIDFSGVPYIGEFLTWHVQYLLQKM